MDFMMYPTFEYFEDRGWLPRINLPENYLELVPKFYERGGQFKIEKYTKDINEKFVGDFDIHLKWDDKKGLRNIDFGNKGLDLTENFGSPHFCEHNLDTRTSIVSGMIAMKYISELYKYKIN